VRVKTVALDDVTQSTPFQINPNVDLSVARGSSMTMDMVLNALEHSHQTIRQFSTFDVDVFALLGMRNLSAFIGEIFAAQMIRTAGGLFRKNPHQDGYPDLLLMDKEGQALWDKLQGRLRDKGPFSPFETGGVEVKATCGSVPTPKELAKIGLEKPDIGDQRISLMRGYDWKAHHRETNNLLAIVWDFIERAPHIVGVFYSNELAEGDWGAIIQPKEGGGRTTSVSIMTRGGVQKMTRAWVAVRQDAEYQDLFSRKCGGIDFYSAVSD
jgi:hypothetical protein